MPKLLKSIFIISSLFFCSVYVFAAEEITITTYYPSPYGSYSSLQTDKLGVGDNDGDDSLTSADVPTTSGDVWIKGKVGIGTTRTDYGKLVLKESGNDQNAGFSIGGINDTDASMRMYVKDNIGVISRGGLQTMNFDTSGNVGIGTTSPGAKLEVVGSADPTISILSGSNSGHTSLGLGRTAREANLGFAGINSQYSYLATPGDLVLRNLTEDVIISAYNNVGAIRFTTGYPNDTERMAILNSGNVGIGATTPTAKLTVGKNVGILGDRTGIYGYGEVCGVRGEATLSGTALYGSGGGIGVQGHGSSYGVNGEGNVYDFYASGVGLDYGTSSSIRWKHNIQPINNALEKVLNLNGVYYDWNEDHGGKHGMGMIAENVGKYVPEVVFWDPDAPGYATGMDYGHLTPVLVEAIKEQQKQIDELSREKQGQQNIIMAQQLEIDGLKVRLDNLEMKQAQVGR